MIAWKGLISTRVASVRNRRNLAVLQGIDEGRDAVLLQTFIIATRTTYALASS